MSDAEQATGAQAAGETLETSDFANLLQKEFKPRNERMAEEVESAVGVMASHALENTELVSDDTMKTLRAMIAKIDEKLTEQLNHVLHHEEFQELEGRWRGLHYLVNNTESDTTLKIRVLNISKKELHKTLKWYKGAAWDQSPIFKRLYEDEYGMFGGEPYGCVVGDYYFDNGPQDVELLGEMAKVGAAAHVPFISAADPGMFLMDSWQELSNPRDIGSLFSTPQHAGFRSLRDSEESRYLGLTMPRFLARLPYGEDNPVEEFDFLEDTAGADSNKFCWANSAYAMGVNINRSFKMYGWCSRIRGVESGGAVHGLPTHTFPTDDGGVDMKCPTEVAISERREAELAKAGFMPLLHKKNTDFAAFIGAQSLHKPVVYDDPDASANANLAARLPYLFATCRFAHYLKAIVRDKVGSFKERKDMQLWLHKWIMQYVHGDPAHASDNDKARKPLAGAEVVVEDVEGNPGYYSAKFFLRPHYQLEGLTVSLRLVSKLPSEKS